MSGDTNLNFAFGTVSVDPAPAGADETDVVRFGLGTLLGWFFWPQFELGFGVSMDYESTECDAEGGAPCAGSSLANASASDAGTAGAASVTVTETTTDYLYGLQAGYFFDLGGMDPFLLALAGYDTVSYKMEADGTSVSEASLAGFGYEARLGVNFLVNEKFGMAPAVYFRGKQVSGTTDGAGRGSEDVDLAENFFGFLISVNAFF
ncbi:MAG: hypothetical protein M5R36_16700 [Deltaproteobacteria bacterium]|nr:hypothetical protein [Deltaproteobacteria bacterium]